MKYYNKLLLLFITLSLFSTNAFAALKKGSGYQTKNLDAYLNSSGVVRKAVHTNDAVGLAQAGFTLGVAAAALLALGVMVYGSVQYVKNQQSGAISNPRMLIASLIFSALFSQAAGTMGFVTGSDCGNNKIYDCVVWTQESSGITGELKEKAEKVTNGEFNFDQFLGVWTKVVGVTQMAAFLCFIGQMFKLYAIANGSDRNPTWGKTIITMVVLALIVDLPHTIDFVKNTAENLTTSTFETSKT